jgi:hypothetical protein
VHPPVRGRPAPGIFHDRLERGTLLPLIEVVEIEQTGGEEAEERPSAHVRSSGWALVVAPESIRVFVHKDYVKALGPVDGEHGELITAARQQREARRKNLAAARRAEASRAAGLRLMQTLGAVQQDLQTLRRAGGTDKTPIVALANRMDEGLEKDAAAAERVLRLARALREDLEREIQLRVARHQAAVARTRGLDPPAVQKLEPVVENAVLEGEIRYEPTPGWTEAGVYFLWMDGRPRFALRLTTGGELPHPDFKAHAGGGLRRIRGRRPGDRLFGLPVLEVLGIEVPEPAEDS